MAKAHPRKYPRRSVRLEADYTVGERSSRCIANSVSGGGLFLTQVAGLEPGFQVSVRFRPAKNLPIIKAKASVRYKKNEGTAVEFTEITSEDRNLLLRFIHRKSSDRGKQRCSPLVTQFQTDNCLSMVFSTDLSLCGMFLETKDPPPVGSALMVRFNLDDKDGVVTTTARVAYLIEKTGMGVLFSELSPAHRAAIEEYIDSHEDFFTSSSPARRFDT
jgi:c-di-GMP-binding flagellar brake protein YcgR